MNVVETWNRIIKRAKNHPFEIHTVPQNKREPLWFRVSTDGRTVIISQAEVKSPSSTLKMPRTITFAEYILIIIYVLRGLL